jgi:hypothetical protein
MPSRDALPARSAPDSAARRLAPAGLARALLDARGRVSPGSPNDAREARAWFASDAAGPFSFRWIAAHLDLDPDNLRLLVSRGTRLAA